MSTHGDELYSAIDKIIESTDDENIQAIGTMMKTDYEFCISLLGFITLLSVENPYFIKELNKQFISLTLEKANRRQD